jgi:hypothetical protein
MLCLSYYAYVFSSTKSVTRAEQDLPETEEGRGEAWGRGVITLSLRTMTNTYMT